MGTNRRTAKLQAVSVMSLALTCSATLLGLSACSTSKNDGATERVSVEVGQLQLDLTAVSTSGRVYRLREGSFSIASQTTKVTTSVSTESSPNETTVRVPLTPDTYEVFLEPGYSVELIEDKDLAFGIRSSSFAGQTRLSGERGDDAASRDASIGDAGTGNAAERLGRTVPAELISSNPAAATITADVVTPLVFVFRVDKDVVQTGTGVLTLGVEVIDANLVTPSTCTDEFEPNDSFAQAALLPSEQPAIATICEQDFDYYVLEPPVAPGEGFLVNFDFGSELGGVDVALFDDAGTLIQAADSTGAGVTLSGVATGGQGVVEVRPHSVPSTGGSYAIDVVAAPILGGNSCCDSSFFPGCTEPEIQQCVCNLDSFCCEVQFDDACAAAASRCGAVCEVEPEPVNATSDCCTATAEPGCADETIVTCVCSADPQCCTGSFDEVCVSQAISECDAACVFGEPESNCCEASLEPGCTLPGVQTCVCALDPFCCVGGFDENCAALAVSQCEATCEG